MIALSIDFLAGRYHANPWGRHVNEGVPEWPPSPWRLLRGLVATWKRKLDADPACPPETMERLFRLLAAPPAFHLPPASTGHLRHYMPWYKKGPTDRTLVFDAFVALDRRASVFVLWPDTRCEPRENAALLRLAASLGFLGRAESWVGVRVLSDDESQQALTQVNCTPVSTDTEGVGQEAIRVLCADPVDAFSNEHTPKFEKVEGRGKGKQKRLIPQYNPDWHLCMETLKLHDEHWSDPPGSRWVTYLRPKDSFAIVPRRQTMRARPKPTIARFVVDAPVLPLIADTLRVAEAARRTAMGIYRRLEEQRLFGGPTPEGRDLPKSAVFSGKDFDGKKLEGHGHAFYLPSDEDGDGRIDHLTIMASSGFGTQEVAALDRMSRLKADHGDPLNLVLMALGQESEITPRRIAGPATTWISATPFIATRHAKSRGRKKDAPHLLGLDNQRAFARQVLIEEISRLRDRRQDLPPPVSVEPLNQEHRMGAHSLRPIQFKRFRQRRDDDGGRRAAGAFRIVFPEPVRGPICLGHSSHFGLGLFVPE